MTAPSVASKRTVRQLVPEAGKPPQASVTSNVWVSEPNVFSRPTDGNSITAFTTGEHYYADFVAACDAAAKEVYIAGWQINWDALLAEGLRLYDVVYRNAKRGVSFYVMPWKHSDPIQTYDGQLSEVFESINKRIATESGDSRKRVFVLAAPSIASVNGAYFSHHQKQVVIDRRIAYVGGIDFCYGRFDDARYDLHAGSRGRQGLNRYNGCVDWLGTLDTNRGVDPDLLQGSLHWATGEAAATLKRIETGGFQVPYVDNSVVTGTVGIAPDKVASVTISDGQPRMPWQDLHSRIEGPAVSNLIRNFVIRWNVVCNSTLRASWRLELPGAPSTFEKKGSASIQVLRSAPASMLVAENKANKTSAEGGTQQDIHVAMKSLIEKSRRFIYIENQFFVSDFGALERLDGDQGLSPAARLIQSGKVGGDSYSDYLLLGIRKWADGNDPMHLPQNGVCRALVQRIQTAILSKDKFHVYITLPVHSEGKLGSALIATQVYYTMQTISHGSRSLLNGIRRALSARQLLDKGEADFMRPLNDELDLSHREITDEACFEYVTLLNLRNWAKLDNGNYVTEQVYVHTKLMIVDDMYALFGSANINDRSLLGERDSEIAVLVVDNNDGRADLNGAGSQRPVRKFAHELRMEVWKKLFGITGGVRPATELKKAIEQPGHPESWKAIQAQANCNSKLYEKAFAFVPRSWQDSEQTSPGSVLPNWERLARRLVGHLPCQKEFWLKPQFDPAAAAQLDGCKGFITALPVHWTQNENVQIPFPTALLVQNETPVQTDPSQTEVASSSFKPDSTDASV